MSGDITLTGPDIIIIIAIWVVMWLIFVKVLG